jgi:hypothetical protein
VFTSSARTRTQTGRGSRTACTHPCCAHTGTKNARRRRAARYKEAVHAPSSLRGGTHAQHSPTFHIGGLLLRLHSASAWRRRHCAGRHGWVSKKCCPLGTPMHRSMAWAQRPTAGAPVMRGKQEQSTSPVHTTRAALTLHGGHAYTHTVGTRGVQLKTRRAVPLSAHSAHARRTPPILHTTRKLWSFVCTHARQGGLTKTRARRRGAVSTRTSMRHMTATATQLAAAQPPPAPLPPSPPATT